MAALALRMDSTRSIRLPADRGGIEAMIESLIELLDTIDGDPDLEEDDPSGVIDEDGINTAFHVLAEVGAGCDISDPGEYEAARPAIYGIDQSPGISPERYQA